MDAPPARGTIVKTTRPSGGRHHRVDAVERRHRRAEADHAEGGSDPVPRASRPAARRSRATPTSFPRASPTPSCRAGGVGRFSAVTLDKILAGKAVAVTPFIDEIDEGMGGGSTPQDLETMFQLIYLRFTQPRADPTAFAAMASQAQGAAREPDGEPGRRVQPDDRRRAQPEQPAAAARDAGDGGPVEPREVAGVLQGALRRREQLHVRLRRQLHARDASGRSSKPTSPACRRRTRTRDLARPRHRAADRASSRRRSRRASRRRARWRSSSPGRSSTTMRTGWRCGR